MPSRAQYCTAWGLAPTRFATSDNVNRLPAINAKIVTTSNNRKRRTSIFMRGHQSAPACCAPVARGCRASLEFVGKSL